jgi:thiaminase/transcriptional activator TenA
MTADFTAELWERIIPIYEAILAHPFLTGLTSGALPETTFRFYVIQDALYLRDFARALAAAAAKAPEDAWCATFAEHARTALAVERALHEGFFRGWGMEERQVYQTPPSPTTLAYTSYLLRVAYASPFEELVGVLLPCYWIYWEVGKVLEQRGSDHPLYRRWIDTYASEEFGASVRAVLEIANRAVADLPASRRQPIAHHFYTASRYEWMFWDSAYRQESWPVG